MFRLRTVCIISVLALAGCESPGQERGTEHGAESGVQSGGADEADSGATGVDVQGDIGSSPGADAVSHGNAGGPDPEPISLAGLELSSKLPGVPIEGDCATPTRADLCDWVSAADAFVVARVVDVTEARLGYGTPMAPNVAQDRCDAFSEPAIHVRASVEAVLHGQVHTAPDEGAVPSGDAIDVFVGAMAMQDWQPRPVAGEAGLDWSIRPHLEGTGLGPVHIGELYVLPVVWVDAIGAYSLNLFPLVGADLDTGFVTVQLGSDTCLPHPDLLSAGYDLEAFGAAVRGCEAGDRESSWHAAVNSVRDEYAYTHLSHCYEPIGEEPIVCFTDSDCPDGLRCAVRQECVAVGSDEP